MHYVESSDTLGRVSRIPTFIAEHDAVGLYTGATFPIENHVIYCQRSVP